MAGIGLGVGLGVGLPHSAAKTTTTTTTTSTRPTTKTTRPGIYKLHFIIIIHMDVPFFSNNWNLKFLKNVFSSLVCTPAFIPGCQNSGPPDSQYVTGLSTIKDCQTACLNNPNCNQFETNSNSLAQEYKFCLIYFKPCVLKVNVAPYSYLWTCLRQLITWKNGISILFVVNYNY